MILKPLIITILASTVVLVPTTNDVGQHPASITPVVPANIKPVSGISQLKESPQAILASKTIAPPPSPVLAPPVQPQGIPSNAAKAFIYQHESGNNPAAVNPGGCRGLGQACPGSKLPCGADYACQDAWFEDYMRRTYGTWENAMAVWQSRCGSAQGCWW